MAVPRRPVLASFFFLFDSIFFLTFSTRNQLISTLSCCFPSVSYYTGTHHTVLILMYGVCKWNLCQSASPLPYKVLRCMFSFISLPAPTSLFSSTSASDTLSVCFVVWLCRMWAGHLMSTPNKWSKHKMGNSSVHQLFKCSDHVN